jgi:hypothetical protein
MPHWLLQSLAWVGIGCGVAAGMLLIHTLVLFDFRRNAEGYILLALRRLKSFLITVLVIEWVVGIFLFVTSFIWSYFDYPLRLLFALITGIVCASFPYALEQILLPKGVRFLRLRRFLMNLAFKLNLTVKYEVAGAIALYRERDVYDCQSNGWDTGRTPAEVGRILRILYEMKKEEIAMERGDTAFLYYDEGRNPWEKFYLLVRYLGRDELRRRIVNPPPPPGDDWDGRERRRCPVLGSKADRANPGLHPERQRCYDNPERLKRIRSRKGYFLPVRKN